MDAYWRAANYLSVGQIYLYSNPLLRRPLTLADVKHMLLGQWPGDVLVLSVRRGGEVLVPHGATLLQTGDTLTLIGSEHYVCEEVARLGG